MEEGFFFSKDRLSMNESLSVEYMLHGIVIKDHGSWKLLLEARLKICLHMVHMEIYLLAKTSDHKVDV